LSRGVHFITGHCKVDETLDIPWEKLTDPEETLVIYMGLASLGQISEKLIAAGLKGSTPAAAIENGTTHKQHRVIATLQTLVGKIKQHNLKSPVMIVIGQVVTLAGSLDWFEPVLNEQQEQPEKEHSVHA
jgi:uroporphyrin-III C-methyltransferase/precorrin-2 dehydrogenase/sirohydrochlorin ferrochelatase/uroporphyrin-III C-methyltransferase